MEYQSRSGKKKWHGGRVLNVQVTEAEKMQTWKCFWYQSRRWPYWSLFENRRTGKCGITITELPCWAFWKHALSHTPIKVVDPTFILQSGFRKGMWQWIRSGWQSKSWRVVKYGTAAHLCLIVLPTPRTQLDHNALIAILRSYKIIIISNLYHQRCTQEHDVWWRLEMHHGRLTATFRNSSVRSSVNDDRLLATTIGTKHLATRQEENVWRNLTPLDKSCQQGSVHNCWI